jgi:hemerythrin superfamily protein
MQNAIAHKEAFMDVVERVRSTLGTYDDGDIRGLLQADHESIRELAKSLAEAPSAPARRSLVAKLKPVLRAHSRAEEKAVYFPLTQITDSPDSRMAGNEGAVEHSLVDVLLTRLADTKDASTDIWKAHAQVLHEMLEHHIKEEEGEMFEELGEHFSDEERQTMAKNFVVEREALLLADTRARRKERA